MIWLVLLSIVTSGRSEELIIEVMNRPSGAQLIKLSGPLTLRTLFDFQETARHHDSHPLIVDAAGIPYMDSAGLGTLIGVFDSCQRTGQKFAISNVSERVMVLFAMTGVKGLLPCFPSIDEAEVAVI
jgi:anti-sigma B factor antagonist